MGIIPVPNLTLSVNVYKLVVLLIMVNGKSSTDEEICEQRADTALCVLRRRFRKIRQEKHVFADACLTGFFRAVDDNY